MSSVRRVSALYGDTRNPIQSRRALSAWNLNLYLLKIIFDHKDRNHRTLRKLFTSRLDIHRYLIKSIINTGRG